MKPYYECNRCNNMFSHSEDLQKHKRTRGHCRPYGCTAPRCTYRASAPSSLQLHSEVQAVTKSYQCQQCDFSTRHKVSLPSHNAALHPSEFSRPRFKCELCDVSTDSESHLKRHAIKHSTSPKLVHCDEPGCDWKSRWASSLIGHKKLHSKSKSNAKWYHCSQCDYQSVLSKGVRWHIKTTHADQRSFLCRVSGCLSCFKTNGDRKKHENTHDDLGMRDAVAIPFQPQRFPCNFPGCDHVAKRRKRLEEHKIRRHSRRIPSFVCNLCSNASYHSFSGLQAHISRDHTKEKLYQCKHPHCDYFTSIRGSLELHDRSHSASEPFHCNFERCKFRSKNTKLLKKHLILVHGVDRKEYVFKCNLCARNFWHYCDLELHMTYHTKEKAYRCNACDYEANRQNSIRSHVCRARAVIKTQKLKELAFKSLCVVALPRIRLTEVKSRTSSISLAR